jgi:RNA ligase
MNYGQALYANLMQLVAANEAFYYVDADINGSLYRVFTYRLASYTDFLLPDALECRGHMFRLNGDSAELVSLPFEKFFNLNENPMTMDLDLSRVEFVHDKRDGSLISTYANDEGRVCLKSKTALASDQALSAMGLMNRDWRLKHLLQNAVDAECTVIMEYTSPENRIVLPYQTDELRVLGARNNTNGEYVPYDELSDHFGDYMVEDYTHMINYPADFIADIPNMKGIEGFVVGLPSGQRIKIKTDEYLSLHRAKDSVNSNKRLFEVCLNDASDDLRSLFHDDAYTLGRITEMEQIVGHAYNHMVSCVEQYHSENKDLDQKSYAIKGQQELDRLHFGLAMSKYHGKQVDYKQSLMRNFKKFVEDNDVSQD